MKKIVCRKVSCKSSMLGFSSLRKAAIGWIIIKSFMMKVGASRKNGTSVRMTLRFAWVSLLVPWF